MFDVARVLADSIILYYFLNLAETYVDLAVHTQYFILIIIMLAVLYALYMHTYCHPIDCFHKESYGNILVDKCRIWFKQVDTELSKACALLHCVQVPLKPNETNCRRV